MLLTGGLGGLIGLTNMSEIMKQITLPNCYTVESYGQFFQLNFLMVAYTFWILSLMKNKELSVIIL